jgi:hypothetical protein
VISDVLYEAVNAIDRYLDDPAYQGMYGEPRVRCAILIVREGGRGVPLLGRGVMPDRHRRGARPEAARPGLSDHGDVRAGHPRPAAGTLGARTRRAP